MLNLLSLMLAAGLAAGASAAGDCSGALELPALTATEFARLEANDPPEFTTKSIEIFAKEGLPELNRIATENEMTIGQLIDDMFASFELIMERIDGGTDRNLKTQMRNLRSNFDGIEKLIGRSKLKANHYLRLQTSMLVLQMSGIFIAHDQLRHQSTTRVNPFGKFDRPYIFHLLSSAEDGFLDRIIGEIDRETRFEEEAARANKAKRAAAEVVPSSDETNLALVLKDDLPLETDRVYRAESSAGVHLNVRIESALVKQSETGHRPAVRRLLKGIMVGKSHAGVKLLTALGPKIVEVKAILHGHKRILGCLDGRDLRLLRMIDIKDEPASYYRRIPRDLCD
jgi:hypothetical protein